MGEHRKRRENENFALKENIKTFKIIDCLAYQSIIECLSI